MAIVDTFVEWRPSGGALVLSLRRVLFMIRMMLLMVKAQRNSIKSLRGFDDFDWRFLPRTQFVINNHWTSVTYTNDEAANGYADPVSSEIGVMGCFHRDCRRLLLWVIRGASS